MPYYAVTLPNGVRFSMLPPSTTYNANSECDVNRWARRSGKNGSVFHSSGLTLPTDRDRALALKRRYQKRKSREESFVPGL
jgi:hypothetical protein